MNVNKLRGVMAEKRYTYKKMAKVIGITPKTFSEKLKKGVFNSDEIKIMAKELDLSDPWTIFFS